MNAPLTTQYDETASAFFAKARRAWVDAMTDDRDLAVLEIGCGTGATGALALRQGKCGSWVGVEMNAREAAEAMFALTDVISADPAVVALPHARSSFGLIFVGHALSGFDAPAKTLKAVAPLLRPGGRFVVSAAGKGVDKKRGFTRHSLRRTLKRAGIEVLMLKENGGKAGFLGLGRAHPKSLHATGKRR